MDLEGIVKGLHPVDIRLSEPSVGVRVALDQIGITWAARLLRRGTQRKVPGVASGGVCGTQHLDGTLAKTS